jgi:hypothetical protein
VSRYEQLDTDGLRLIPFAERENRVTVDNLYHAPKPRKGCFDLVASLPPYLAGNDMRTLVDSLVKAHAEGMPIILMMGSHVIKVGLSPLIIDLIDAGAVSLIGMNGSGPIHDAELALLGGTSEDVGRGIKEGVFGLVKETGDFLNGALNKYVPEGLGYGEALGKALAESGGKHIDVSVLGAAYKKSIPVTVHISMVTDIHQMHPQAKGDVMGEGSFRDFRIFLGVLKRMVGGGVIINAGSAVILPLVIEKGLSVVRNLGYDVGGFVGANLDFIVHYRSNYNPVVRARELGGIGMNLIGHHEINIPLVMNAYLEKIGK